MKVTIDVRWYVAGLLVMIVSLIGVAAYYEPRQVLGVLGFFAGYLSMALITALASRGRLCRGCRRELDRPHDPNEISR